MNSANPINTLAFSQPKEDTLKSKIPFLIYESYKTTNFEDSKELIDYLLCSKPIIPNEIEETDNEGIFDNDSEESPKKEKSTDESFVSSLPPESPLKIYLNKTYEPPPGYLGFDSNFECGNLDRVFAKSQYEYDLYVNSDTNANNRCQWFYFMTYNTIKDKTVKFNIVNLTKYARFLKEGMKPLIFSEMDNSLNKISGWTNKTDGIQMAKNCFPPQYTGDRIISVEGLDEEEKLPNQQINPYNNKTGSYTLSFTHTFKYDNDKVYFAFWKPYSYTRLQKFFQKQETLLVKEACAAGTHNNKKQSQRKKRSSFWLSCEAQIETRDISYKREQLCLSLGGIPVDLVTITSSNLQQEEKFVELRKRKYIVITGRAHAGETAGSHKAEGIIKFLLGKDPIANSLRQEHIFLIVPMLNPDGVVLGNNRCSLCGTDLNRCWDSPRRDLQTTIFQLKAMLSELYGSKKTISLYCDLHGHSQLLDSFIFACHTISSGNIASWTKVRLLPRIFSKKCHILKYPLCRFKVEPDKLSTARIVIWKEFGVTNSFTLESSQYAYTMGDEIIKFTEKDYNKVAVGFMESLHEYERLLDQLHAEMKEYRKIQEPCWDDSSFEKNENPAKNTHRRNEKLKIRVQMSRIPAFHKSRVRSKGKTFDSGGSNNNTNTENESGSSKNAASPTSQERINDPDSVKHENIVKIAPPSIVIQPKNEKEIIEEKPKEEEKQLTWKDYFTQHELEEIVEGFNVKNSNDELSEAEQNEEPLNLENLSLNENTDNDPDKLCDLPAKYISEANIVENENQNPQEKSESSKTGSPEPNTSESPVMAPKNINLRTNFDYKDLIHIGYAKKSREIWDSWSTRLTNNITPVKTQKKILEKLPPQYTPNIKRNSSKEKQQIRPGTSSQSVADRIRKTKIYVEQDKPQQNINIIINPVFNTKITTYKESQYIPSHLENGAGNTRGIIVRIPQFTTQNFTTKSRVQRAVRGISNNGVIRCIVPTEGEKSMTKTFYNPREKLQSMRKQRFSIDPLKRSNTIAKNPFTNSKIREHIAYKGEND